jgi:hypothetical protein
MELTVPSDVPKRPLAESSSLFIFFLTFEKFLPRMELEFFLANESVSAEIE